MLEKETTYIVSEEVLGKRIEVYQISRCIVATHTSCWNFAKSISQPGFKNNLVMRAKQEKHNNSHFLTKTEPGGIRAKVGDLPK